MTACRRTVLGIYFKAVGVELIAFSQNFPSILVGAESGEPGVT